ncbi:MAG: S8 family serine peptidase [Candidatus Nitrosopumilus limneticus]|nr:Peptidase S8 [Candidatus Nitrosopumilus limneticus]MDC4211717.1 S8 family serine peptidase [Candidatus Nitrosopumilus limneticus]MDC4214575.1 S8 family serine peptidase [Candidatus Nitrosopumilus limneticus]MDC4215772.1 S8 family serine peptidase [Candidatus Nitrosopumilus limneticus]MDC4216453.1 S8 family serine peptidase [Candidatus Nitrosopumilus limneticus]
MKLLVIFSILLIFTSSLIVLQLIESENKITTYIENSLPYIGTEIPRMEGMDGTGIKIAVIDTGVDFNHPDLFGWGPDGKVIGGYNFIQPTQLPMDTNGHGTKVAGIIAADGNVLGVAPKAKILAYKVSEDGEGVSSELISGAIQKAIEDKADIINISLGVNRTNSKIDNAVNHALDNGIFVVTAAGNDGPGLETIGSPGKNFKSITVGATYNNLTSSLIATLEIDEKQYTVIPMVGSSKTDKPITGKIIAGDFGKNSDLENLDVKDSILIVERGSDVEGELLFFSIKEMNAAKAGAKALIVYNNVPGIFLGELIHEFSEPGYLPQIPVVSIDREEGLEIIESIEKRNSAIINLFFNPDFVAHFSSRGPVSPFYIKPDIVAPGAYINTTQINSSYNLTSGTSFAAPHVSGAAALLMQKNPELQNHEIKSLLVTTVQPVSNAYGQKFSIHDSGSGRLDIASAYNAKLIINPINFVINLSPDQLLIEKQLEIKLIEGTLKNMDVIFEGPEFIEFSHDIKNGNLQILFKVIEEKYGEHEGKILINHEKIRYTIPVIIHYTEGSVSVFQENKKLFFEINHPEKWSFAKIIIINSLNGNTDTITATPDKIPTLEIYENGEYWIDVKIKVENNTSNVFNTIKITSLSDKIEKIELIDIPEKQIILIISILIIAIIIGLLIRR